MMVIAVCAVIPEMSFAQSKRLEPCGFGPVRKTYGSTDWFVLSCKNKRMVIVYPMPNNPSSPYYFLWMRKAGGRLQLLGRGIGNQAFAEAARTELRSLSRRDFAALIKETEAASAAGARLR